MQTVHLRRRRAPALALILAGTLVLGGCDSLLSSEAGLADEVVVRVTGSASVPLLLVTSTRFGFEYDQLSGEYDILLATADTVRVTTLPHTARRDLKGRDRYLVRLVNPDLGVTVDVGMEVELDGRLVYSQRASLLDATLEYFTWFSPLSGN